MKISKNSLSYQECPLCHIDFQLAFIVRHVRSFHLEDTTKENESQEWDIWQCGDCPFRDSNSDGQMQKAVEHCFAAGHDVGRLRRLIGTRERVLKTLSEIQANGKLNEMMEAPCNGNCTCKGESKTLISSLAAVSDYEPSYESVHSQILPPSDLDANESSWNSLDNNKNNETSFEKIVTETIVPKRKNRKSTMYNNSKAVDVDFEQSDCQNTANLSPIEQQGKRSPLSLISSPPESKESTKLLKNVDVDERIPPTKKRRGRPKNIGSDEPVAERPKKRRGKPPTVFTEHQLVANESPISTSEPLQCAKCMGDKRFISSSLQVRHVMSLHTDKDKRFPFGCSKCSAEFVRMDKANSHTVQEHGEEADVYWRYPGYETEFWNKAVQCFAEIDENLEFKNNFFAKINVMIDATPLDVFLEQSGS